MKLCEGKRKKKNNYKIKIIKNLREKISSYLLDFNESECIKEFV